MYNIINVSPETPGGLVTGATSLTPDRLEIEKKSILICSNFIFDILLKYKVKGNLYIEISTLREHFRY